MDLNFTRSLFVDKLIPQYIREEYPLFVSFVKEYYNYLDRKSGQLAVVKIKNTGKNYSSVPTITMEILDTNPDSITYNQYISDYKGAAFNAFVVNGKLEKILVTNYGSGYSSEDKPRIIITDATGTGATAEPVIIDSPGGINQSSKLVAFSRDIDNEVDVFVDFLKNEYIPTLPQKLYKSQISSVEVTKFVKFIRQFYNSTGVEDSIRFLYRILFNVEVNFYYPKVDVLRTSAGRWQLDNVLRVYPAPVDLTEFKNNNVGSRILITGATGVATAILENVEKIGSTGPHALLYLSTINGFISPTGGQTVLNYPITGATGFLGNSYVDGATGAFYSTNGRYIGDDGQLDSTKKIQGSPNIAYGASGALPYYYQDFSYELQSEESIRQFKGLLEELVHPAGLVYFIRLTIEKSNQLGGNSSQAITDVFIGADQYYSSELVYNAGATGLNYSLKDLGPTALDFDKFKWDSYPQPYVDFSGIATVTSNTSYNTLVISTNISSSFIGNKDEYTNYSVIITDLITDINYYRYVTAYNPDTFTITLNSSFTTGASTNAVQYRIIQNYRFGYVNPTTVGLSTLDPMRYVPFDPSFVSTLITGATSASGATGFVLNTSDNFNVKVGDVLKVDSEDLLVNYIVGATGSFNISATRGFNSTTIAGHSIGATAYNKTDHRYRNWRLYVTSGPGAGQFSKVTTYGATGVLGFSDYTINTGSTGPTTDSTYWLVPDFAGATGSVNDGYFTTGSTGISEIVISNPGAGYSQGATGVYVDVAIAAPPYGTQATATVTVGATGAISAINITNYGSGYLFTPLVTINQIGATSPTTTAFAYANILNTNLPMSQFENISYSAGVILSVADAKNKFKTATATANLDPITGTTVFSCNIIEPGIGYIKTPSITFRKGGGSGAAAVATIAGGSVTGITMLNLGFDYVEPPDVKFEDPIIEPGEVILQDLTGAKGRVELWDKENNFLYVVKDPGSLDFAAGQISYNDINIVVSSVVGYYDTSGKRINSLPESEIAVI